MDVLSQERVVVRATTNYQVFTPNSSLDHVQGYVYWGEYPLYFAACLGQEESYRLILARWPLGDFLFISHHPSIALLPVLPSSSSL